jgi:hypothetical protein
MGKSTSRDLSLDLLEGLKRRLRLALFVRESLRRGRARDEFFRGYSVKE